MLRVASGSCVRSMQNGSTEAGREKGLVQGPCSAVRPPGAPFPAAHSRTGRASWERGGVGTGVLQS